MKHLCLAIAVPLLLLGSVAAAADPDTRLAAQGHHGPAKGTLVLVGGGSDRGAGIIETFVNRAGGPEASYVIVPTAEGNRTADGQPKLYREEDVLALWRTRGLKHVRMLHTFDPKVANTEEFVQPLREANAIWFDGDHAQDLLDSYADTLAQREFLQVLQRGGVIGGNTAGTAVQGTFLLRPDVADTVTAPSVSPVRPAFGFLPNTILDLQVNTRHRWDDLTPLIKAHPELLGIGLSESTAIVVTGDLLEVAGKWTVAIHDSTTVPTPESKPYRILQPGDIYNLSSGQREKLGTGMQSPPPMTPAPTAKTAPPAPAAPPPLSYGPAKGSLVIVGGGNTRGTGIMEQFVNRAGGINAKIVLIPTAGGNRTADGKLVEYKEDEILAPWRRGLGLKNIRMLHTADPKVADTEEFVQCLREADGVWFDGGRQWNLVDSYAGTLAQREFEKVLERGGVIGGTSAGATIIGDYLVRGAVAGPDIVMAPEPEHQRGFAFLRHVAIDQHINTRNRWDDLTPVMRKYPEFLGIGLSEGTAILVEGDRFTVIGKWKVTIHDSTQTYEPWEKPYSILSAGDVFNLQTRRVEQVGNQPVALKPLIGVPPPPPPKVPEASAAKSAP